MTQGSTPKDVSPLTPEELRLQRILKLVVTGLGILILGVLAAMIWMVVNGGRKSEDAPLATATSPAAVMTAPFNHEISLPPRAMVMETRVDGSTLLLRLTLPEGGEEIMVVDMPTGEVKGRIRLKTTE